jgi:hypothetical protein
MLGECFKVPWRMLGECLENVLKYLGECFKEPWRMF